MKKIKNWWMGLLLLAGVAITSCNDDDKRVFPETPEETYDMTGFARGADVSWLTEMEAEGRTFYDTDGKERECMSLLRELGMNAIRLRVWVNPADGWCNQNDVIAKAWRAHNLGYRLMIDFHYSDTWADPGSQTKPAAWENYTFDELRQAVTTHTTEVLTALKNQGIDVEWVQVGNETSNGMLWDTGKADPNMANYAMMTAAGYKAVKEIFPDAKVIVHLDHGDRPDLYNWIFDGLKANGAEWDMIGMSLYPEYYAHEKEEDYQEGEYRNVTDAALANALALWQKYGTPVMIAEVGMTWSKVDESYAFLSELMTKARALGDGKACAGVFYWEPESNPAWSGYAKGAFDENFRPTRALDAFKD